MSVFGRFAGAVGPMNTGKWSGDGDAGGSPTPSQPSPSPAAFGWAGLCVIPEPDCKTRG